MGIDTGDYLGGVKSIDVVISDLSEEIMIQKLEELFSNGNDIEQKDNEGKTVLVWAAEIGLEKVLDFLLKQGANPSSKDIENGVPILWAAHVGQNKTLIMLLENGAEVNSQDNEGYTALMFATMYGHVDTSFELLKRGVDVNLKSIEGYTAKQIAIYNSFPDVVALFNVSFLKKLYEKFINSSFVSFFYKIIS